MRAKDYANQYKSSKDKGQALGEIAKAMIVEIADIAKQRHCQSASSIVSVFKEQEQKWQALIRLLPNEGIKESGFRDLFKMHFPEMTDALNLN